MRWWLVFLVGCGRVGFDHADATLLPSCAGHDEDGDGFPDPCDLCPHVADATQPNRDGDGVSDACDPTPGQETIAVFDPFTAELPEWSFQGAQQTYAGDALTLDARPDYFFMARPGTASNDYFQIRGTIVSVGTGSAQITITFYVAGRPHYYCELYGGATMSKVAMTYTLDDMTFTSLSETPLPGFAPGPFVLIADHRAPNLLCSGQGAAASGAIPAAFAGPPDRIAIQINGLELRVDYFVQIHTN